MATAFAVFCATDGSLTFYNRDTVPAVGDMFEGKVVSNVYTGFDTASYGAQGTPWYKDANYSNIISVSFVDTISPTYMNYWFYGMNNMSIFDMTNLDTSNLIQMDGLFYNCSSLTTLDVTGFDTSKLKRMYSTFFGCSSLTILDISSFDTSNVTQMGQAFYGCSNLKTIYVSDLWNISMVTASTSMFTNCTSLVGAVPYDSTKTNASMANYETGYFTYKRYVKPEDMLIKNTTLYNIADEIRILYGTEDTMTPAVITNQLSNANIEVDEQTDLIKQILEALGIT